MLKGDIIVVMDESMNLHKGERRQKITDIKRQKKRDDRVSVWLDDRFWKGLDSEVLVTLKIKKGDEVSRETLKRLVFLEEKKKSLSKAYKLLEYRDRSINEMRDRLKRNGYDDQVVDVTITELKDLGYLNDRKFARMWTSERTRNGFGQRKIESELKEKGISKEVIEETLKVLGDEVEEEEKVRKLVEKRLPLYRGDNPPKAYRKLSQYLIRKGFTPSTVNEVTRTMILDEENY